MEEKDETEQESKTQTTSEATNETDSKTTRTNTQDNNKDARTDNHTQEKETYDRTDPKRQKRQDIKSVTHWRKITKQWQQAEDKRKTRKGRKNKRMSKQDTTGQPSITQFMTKKRKTETTKPNPKKRSTN